MAFLRTRQKNFSKTQTLAWETLDVEWLSALLQRVCALSQAEQSEFHNKHPLLYAQLIFISLGEGDRRLEGTFLKVPHRSENLLAWDLVPPKIAENVCYLPMVLKKGGTNYAYSAQDALQGSASDSAGLQDLANVAPAGSSEQRVKYLDLGKNRLLAPTNRTRIST